MSLEKELTPAERWREGIIRELAIIHASTDSESATRHGQAIEEKIREKNDQVSSGAYRPDEAKIYRETIRQYREGSLPPQSPQPGIAMADQESAGQAKHGTPITQGGTGNASRALSQEFLVSLLHPKESARVGLVWLSAALTVLVLVLTAVWTFGVTLLVITIVVLQVFLLIWLVKQLAYALFRANAVEIGPAQFPEIHKRIEGAARRLGLTKRVTAFIVNQGELNAFFYRKSGRDVLVFNSMLIEDMSTAELDFFIFRFLGYLRAREIDFGAVVDAISILNAVPILGLLTRSYERAAVLSGDRIGAYACGSTEAARTAMAKLAVGAKLQPQFSSEQHLMQALEFRLSAWNFLTRLRQDHPHFSDRMIELEDWIGEVQDQVSYQPKS